MNIFDKLIVFQMANNHMGDFYHGIRMINQFKNISSKYGEFKYAWKFQLRDIDTFIHKDYMNRDDLKYVKRFKQTKLSRDNIIKLKQYAKSQGFLTMCTAFDQKSVDLIQQLNFDIAKVASCSSTDWPLLNRVVKLNLPIIISTAGTKLEDIDNIVSFLKHRNKQYALMHCVGQYPTLPQNLQLNQIDLLKARYQVPVGFSTHETPNLVIPIQLAIAKGASIFQKHVAVVTDQYPRNAYSAIPDQIDSWLEFASNTYKKCGVCNERHEFSNKQLEDLRKFKRGVFLKKNKSYGDVITRDDVYYAFPNIPEQILANDMSKYVKFKLLCDIKADQPLLFNNTEKIQIRQKVWNIIQAIRKFLKESKFNSIPNMVDLQLSHHYGIDNYYNTGLAMLTCVNEQYCKKILISLPQQQHPQQYHNMKKQTFHVLYGEVHLYLNGVCKILNVGDIVTIQPSFRHYWTTPTGCIIQQISSTHYKDDSYYSDSNVMKDRKTIVPYWR